MTARSREGEPVFDRSKKNKGVELDHDVTLVQGPDGTLRVLKSKKDRAHTAEEIRGEGKDLLGN